MIEFFASWFTNPSVIGILLALAFGAVWLAPYAPPLFKKPWLWAVLVVSAIITLLAVTFIQVPLQGLVSVILLATIGNDGIVSWLPLVAIPSILLSGLVQQGAKMVPMVFYWSRSHKSLDPKMGLMLGAVAGAGFGIFEAVWIHNEIFASGWSWALVQSQGYLALLGFWERFFTISAHIGFSALAGYGLAKGYGWQFYLIAAGLHSLMNYGVVLLSAGILTSVQVEIEVAMIAVIVSVVALWLRWRKTGEPLDKVSLE